MSMEYAVQMLTECGWAFCALNNRTTKQLTTSLDEAKDSLAHFRRRFPNSKFRLACRYVGDWCEAKE